MNGVLQYACVLPIFIFVQYTNSYVSLRIHKKLYNRGATQGFSELGASFLEHFPPALENLHCALILSLSLLPTIRVRV